MNDFVAGRSHTILCVDNGPERCGINEVPLSEWQVTHVRSARDALIHHNRTPFDLYVLDYWLPDFSGVNLCRDIRRDDPHVPVVLCANEVGEQYRNRATRAGANAYVCKPIDAELFKARVGALLKLTDLENQRALRTAQNALREELVRRAASDPRFLERAAVTVERVARRKVLDVFIREHGTRACFERAWRGLWASEQAPFCTPAVAQDGAMQAG
jgi:DNA-binding response OmpR family regulator